VVVVVVVVVAVVVVVVAAAVVVVAPYDNAGHGREKTAHAVHAQQCHPDGESDCELASTSRARAHTHAHYRARTPPATATASLCVRREFPENSDPLPSDPPPVPSHHRKEGLRFDYPLSPSPCPPAPLPVSLAVLLTWFLPPFFPFPLSFPSPFFLFRSALPRVVSSAPGAPPLFPSSLPPRASDGGQRKFVTRMRKVQEVEEAITSSRGNLAYVDRCVRGIALPPPSPSAAPPSHRPTAAAAAVAGAIYRFPMRAGNQIPRPPFGLHSAIVVCRKERALPAIRQWLIAR
jgi:hypothetical protein